MQQSTIEMIIIVLTLIIYIYIILFISSEEKIYKKEIWEKLIQAINNGADIDIINNILKNQKRVKKIFNKNIKNEYYSKYISLSSVLEDIRANQYLNNNNEMINEDLVKKLNILLEEDKKKSPFDGLEEKQKDFFNNILNILDKESFSKIQSNINKISNELALKTEEAKKAKLNFKIAIISIAITIIIGIYQLYDNYNTKIEYSLVFNKIIKLLTNH